MGKESPGIHFPPPLIFIVGFVVGLGIDKIVPLPLPGSLAGIKEWIGLVLAAGGILLAFWAMGNFFARRTPVYPNSPATSLVRTGPYRFTRNPMYVGLTSLYMAGALWVNVLWALIMLPFVLVAMNRFIIAREEEHLEHQFGDDYLSYKSDVRRWI